MTTSRPRKGIPDVHRNATCMWETRSNYPKCSMGPYCISTSLRPRPHSIPLDHIVGFSSAFPVWSMDSFLAWSRLKASGFAQLLEMPSLGFERCTKSCNCRFE